MKARTWFKRTLVLGTIVVVFAPVVAHTTAVYAASPDGDVWAVVSGHEITISPGDVVGEGTLTLTGPLQFSNAHRGRRLNP